MNDKPIKVRFKGKGTDFKFHGNYRGNPGFYNTLIGAMKKSNHEIEIEKLETIKKLLKENKCLAEIAKMVGYTQARVSQIKNQIIAQERVKKEHEKNDLNDQDEYKPGKKEKK